VRTDIVDVYIFRRPAASDRPGVVEFLQLLRTGDPLGGTWQPVMGHIEAGETAVRTALREVKEEVGLMAGDPALLGMWALEQVHPYYVVAIEAIVLSPRFCIEVDQAWEPRLNSEHSARRWITAPRHVRGSPDAEMLRAACDQFMWPGSKRAVEEVVHEIVREGSLARETLRVDVFRRG
jgi:8-oxo-dGTP pyrophosphatase MutT (NUDIX family)